MNTGLSYNEEKDFENMAQQDVHALDQEEQRIAELMKPRVKIIAPWPHAGPFKVGDILMQFHPEVDIWRTCVNGIWSKSTIHDVSKYPHLFKRLEWWEDRKPEEMPEYVKDKYNQVHKVTSVERIGANLEKGFYAHWKNVQPATLAEYQQYINSKQQP